MSHGEQPVVTSGGARPEEEDAANTSAAPATDPAADASSVRPSAETPATEQSSAHPSTETVDAEAADTEPTEIDEPEAAEIEADEPEADEGLDPIIKEPEPGSNKQWYVLKVQSNREDSIREAILRKVKIAGLEHLIDEIVVPTEKVSEIKAGKKRVTERKFFPGYIIMRLEMDNDLWFTIRETPGVGDFVGSGGKPLPMTESDVAKMLGRKEEAAVAAEPKLKINFQKGDRVKIKEGPFENFEGQVEEVNEAKGLVKIMIQVFGRPAPVELEYWQVEPV